MKILSLLLFFGGGWAAVRGTGPRILRKIWQRKTNVLYLGFQGFCQIINLNDTMATYQISIGKQGSVY